jgi:hypothetical protein
MPQPSLRALLVERLERQGVEPPHMVGFLRELTKLIRDCPEILPTAVNERLQYLGWSDVAVDYQSVQLAAVCLQDE